MRTGVLALSMVLLLVACEKENSAQKQPTSDTKYNLYMTGERFVDACKGDSPGNLILCDSFVYGVADAMELTTAANRSKDEKRSWICPPDQHNLPNVVRAYIAAHPDRLEEGAAKIVYMALTDAYRCGKK